jgi:hypothetical protein
MKTRPGDFFPNHPALDSAKLILRVTRPTETAVVAWGDSSPFSDSQCVGSAARGMDVMILNESLKRVHPSV